MNLPTPTTAINPRTRLAEATYISNNQHQTTNHPYRESDRPVRIISPTRASALCLRQQPYIATRDLSARTSDNTKFDSIRCAEHHTQVDRCRDPFPVDKRSTSPLVPAITNTTVLTVYPTSYTSLLLPHRTSTLALAIRYLTTTTGRPMKTHNTAKVSPSSSISQERLLIPHTPRYYIQTAPGVNCNLAHATHTSNQTLQKKKKKGERVTQGNDRDLR